LIFCDVGQGKLDCYQGIPVTSGAVIDYLQEVAALKLADRTGILTHAYRYLDHADPVIAEDAWVEFSHDADPMVGADYRPLAGRMSADRIARWLRDPKTPDWRLGLYAQLLGHCGGVEHAQLLLKMLDNKEAQPKGSGLAGLLIGYTLLQPR